MSSMTNRAFHRWLLVLWLPLAASAVVIALLRCGAVLDNGASNSTTAFEDISIANVSAIAHGEPAYVDCFSYPYRTSLFNWLFYRTYGAVARLTAPAPAQLPTALRLLTFSWVWVGVATTVRLLAPFARGLDAQGGVLIASFATLTWFGPIICWWPWTVRPDLPAIVLEYAAFALVLRSESAGRVAAAGALFFFAWSFKQNEVALLAGTVLALLLGGSWRRALLLGGVFAVPAGAVLLQADEAYWLNIAHGPAVAGWSVDRIWFKVANWLLLGGAYLVVPGVLLAYALSPAERRDLLKERRVRMTAAAFAAALALNLLGSGRQWSACNYYYESWIIGMTFTGMVTLRAAQTFTGFGSAWARNAFVGSVFLLLATCAAYTVAVFVPLDKPYRRTGENLEYAVRLPRPVFSAALLAAVKSSPPPLFCDDPLLLVQALDRDAVNHPVIEYTIYLDALRAGLLRDDDIATRIRNRWFAMVWLESTGSMWEPALQEAGYTPGAVVDSMRPWMRPP